MHYWFRHNHVMHGKFIGQPQLFMMYETPTHTDHIMSINYYYHYLQLNFMMFIMGTILMIAIANKHVRRRETTCCTRARWMAVPIA